ncbi:hypothetical protein SDC9_196063 [bioreactor metagenome]|uniref:Uncharacterized protein n=1 Tax=bioreactor metagenome TaxID=1076179 RepID=A0A645IC11_9ZZZZ
MHGLIQLLRRLDLFALGLGAHRHIALGLVIADDGNGIGPNPVVVPVLAPVLDQCAPGLAAFERGPHVGKSGRGHVRVAHQIVRLPEDLLRLEAADLHERLIGIFDVALRVRGGHQSCMLIKAVLPLCHWCIDSHRCRFLVINREKLHSLCRSLHCGNHLCVYQLFTCFWRPIHY